MTDDFGSELAALCELSVRQLRSRFEEVFGEATRSRHRQHLIRRIAWRLQVLREGDVSERARRRADELARAAELRLSASAGIGEQDAANGSASARPRGGGRRYLAPGTVIRRAYKGRMITVQVLGKGFCYEGRTYKSLTAVAEAVSGTHWNGYHFFGMQNRKARP